MVRVYLRVVVGALNAFCAVAVATAAYVVTAMLCLNQLMDNADEHVASIGAAGAYRVDEYFYHFQTALSGVADHARMVESFPLPSDDPTTRLTPTQLRAQNLPVGGIGVLGYDRLWWSHATQLQFGPLLYTLWFRDGSRFTSVPGTTHTIYEQLVHDNNTGPGPGVGGPLQRLMWGIDTKNKALFAPGENAAVDQQIAHRRATARFSDSRHPLVQKVLELNANMTPGATPTWSDVRLFHDTQDQLYLYAAAPVFNRSLFLVADHFALIGVNRIADELSGVQPTAHTLLVVVDKAGFLLGATQGLRVIDRTEGVKVAAADLKPGCTSTELTKASVPSSKDVLICRPHISGADHKALRYLASDGRTTGLPTNDDEAANARSITATSSMLVDGFQTHRSIGGEQYFIYVSRLKVSSLGATVIAIVPEEDVLGAIEKQLTRAVIISSVVVIVLACVSFCIVWVVVRPLEGIAELMGQTARLQTTGDDVSESRFVEISDLQRAFVEMRDELDRIRAFVPQSLLAGPDSPSQLTDVDCECDTEAYAAAAEDDSCVQVAAAARLSNSGSLSLSQNSPCPEGGVVTVVSAGTVSPRALATVPASPMATMDESPSKRSKERRYVAPAPRVMISVKRDTVSVLIVNLRGFHAAVASGVTPAKVADTVDAVLKIVQAEKGVVDSFHGDRYAVSFNAVRPAANHGIRAAVAAARIAIVLGGDTETHHGFGLPVSCGVATGPAQVGNLGSDTMKRFSIIGPVVTQAAALERMCKLHSGAQCLVPQRLFEDLRTAVQLRTVDYVQLPFAKNPCLVADVLQEHKQSEADDEWMYQLQGQQEPGPELDRSARNSGAGSGLPLSPQVALSLGNELWASLVGNNLARADRVVAALGHAAPMKVVGRLEAMRATGRALDPTPLGVFYDEAVLSKEQGQGRLSLVR